MLSTRIICRRIAVTSLISCAIFGFGSVLADDAMQPTPAATTPAATKSTTTAPATTAPTTMTPATVPAPAMAPSTPAPATPAAAPSHAMEPAPAVEPAPAAASTPAASTAPTGGKTLSSKNIARATFTSNVVNHEPVDTLKSVSKANGKVYYFTVLKNMKGEKVIHRWEYNGKVMAKVEFTAGSPLYRVYSVKTIKPTETGKWTVVVTDMNGNVLKTDSIDVTE